MNLNEDGYRTFTFQLNLSSILFHEQYLPLALLNGILLEIHLTTATDGFYYDPVIESWDNVFNNVEGLLTQVQYNALSADAKTTVQEQLTQFYQRPAPAGQELLEVVANTGKLCDQPETGNREVVIERERKPDAHALHDGEAGRVHGRQLVQVRAPKILPRLLQIAQLAGKDPDGSRFVDRTLPRQGHVPVGIALKKGECLNHHGN